MAGVNTKRIVAGGLAAGLVINVVETVMNLFVLVEPMEGLMEARNLEPVAGPAIAGFTLLAFVLGMMTVWIYAAIRPRYGEGPGTALRAGLAVWALFYLLPLSANSLMGLFPTGMFVAGLAYSLPMMLVAAYVGGMLYKEA